MKIMREKPCQRMHHRLSAPLFVSINGNRTIKAHDWSLGGLRIDDFDGPAPIPNEQLSLYIELPFQGFQIAFDVTARVVRFDENTKSVFLEYIDLSERSFDLMNHFVDDLIRGKMATIDDTICRIDVPVTPISTSPTPNPTNEVPTSRLPIKSIVMSFFYITLGLFVFSYIALILYGSYFKMEVPTSVISSRLQTLKMPTDGIIQAINFEVGARLVKGDTIFRVDNAALTAKISSIKSRVQIAENALETSKEKYRIENERMKLYQIVSRTDKKILQAQLAAKKEELNAADSNFIRLKRLYDIKAVTQTQLNDAKHLQNTVVYQVEELEAKYAQAVAMEAASERRHYNHKEFATDLDIMAVELQSAYKNLQIERQQLETLILSQNKQVVRAPYDGKITNLFYATNSTIAKNSPILTIEEIGKSMVSAFLNQEEVLHIGLMDKANVYIPALGLEVSAIIVDIDRSSAFIDKESSQYAWRDKKQRTALVSLELTVNNDTAELISAGLPAVVIFNRRSTSNIFSKVINFVSSKSKTKVKTDHSRRKYDSI